MTLDGAMLDSHRVRVDPDVEGVHEVHARLGSHVIDAIRIHTA